MNLNNSSSSRNNNTHVTQNKINTMINRKLYCNPKNMYTFYISFINMHLFIIIHFRLNSCLNFTTGCNRLSSSPPPTSYRARSARCFSHHHAEKSLRGEPSGPHSIHCLQYRRRSGIHQDMYVILVPGKNQSL